MNKYIYNIYINIYIYICIYIYIYIFIYIYIKNRWLANFTVDDLTIKLMRRWYSSEVTYKSLI